MNNPAIDPSFVEAKKQYLLEADKFCLLIKTREKLYQKELLSVDFYLNFLSKDVYHASDVKHKEAKFSLGWGKPYPTALKYRILFNDERFSILDQPFIETPLKIRMSCKNLFERFCEELVKYQKAVVS